MIGAGYVGLTTAVCLAHLGHRVCCGELDEAKVTRLSRGEPTILEDGLEELLGEGLASGRLRFVIGAAAAVDGADFVFLCVPTPQRPDGSADVTVLESVAREIGPHLAHGAVVVNKSTVPVGSALLVERLLDRPEISVVSNPEFLREGSAVHDCLHPDRIVVGADDQAAAARVGALFAATQAPLIVTDAATAETIKYASNAFLATKLCFVNAVANLCEAVGADVRDVLLGMAYDHRIGFDYLRPGPGWGGSCLPKDTRALLFMAENGGLRLPAPPGGHRDQRDPAHGGRWPRSATPSGDRWPARRSPSGASPSRPAPTTAATPRPWRSSSGWWPTGRASGPTTPRSPVRSPSSPAAVEICADPYAACDGAAAVVVLTEWEELRWLDFAKVRALLAEPSVVDARNLLDPSALRRMGFAYVGVGRP